MPLRLAITMLFGMAAFWMRGAAEFKALPKFDGSKAGFTLLMPEQTGVSFSNVLALDRHLTNQIFLNGSGVAAGDVDGDGLCDLFFCGLDSPNALYRNLGAFKFSNATAAGIKLDHLDCTGANLADLDGDHDLDLVVNTVGSGTHILLNDGKGKFTATSAVQNLNKAGMSSALADIDQDGDLDLYIANYRTTALRDEPNTRFNFKLVNRQPVVTSINGKSPESPEYADRFTFAITFGERGGTISPEEQGEADLFLRNDGKGNFQPIELASGIFRHHDGKPLAKPLFSWGLSAAFRDLSGDSLPDLYICNDFKSPDEIWINSGKGYFTHLEPLALRQMTLSSMGIDFADLNNDGRDDMFVLDMLSQDHIRRLTQRVDMKPEMILPGQITNQPQYPRNSLYISRPDDTYAEMAYYAGLEASEWAWTPIFLDVDLDGDEDLLVSNGFERDNMNVDALQKIETLKKQKKYTNIEQLRLREHFPRLATPNTAFKNLGNLQFADASQEWGFNLPEISQGMALADLDNDGDMDVVVNNMNAPAAIYRNNAEAPRILVSLKAGKKNSRGIGAKIIVKGPDGKTQQQEIMAGGRYLSSDQPARSFAAKLGLNHSITVIWPGGSVTIVSNVSANTNCQISDETVAPFKPLTPKLSPLFVQSKAISYSPPETPLNDFILQPSLPYAYSQNEPHLKWVDHNKDGWEDLLVSTDVLFTNKNGIAFEKSATASKGEKTFSVTPGQFPFVESNPWFSGPGIISGYKTADLNNDGIYETILATQPGPIRIFSNKKEITKEAGLENTSGWWNCVEVADLNSDGLLDIVAGNIGLNTRFTRYLNDRVSFYVGDSNGDGTIEFLEACDGKPLQPLYKLGMFLPELRGRFPTMESYAHATFAQIHQPYFAKLQRIGFQVAHTVIFFNEGGKFRQRALPQEAQISPCNAISVADFDGDGTQDLFLAQNIFRVPLDGSRHDSGLGLLLANDGKGNFTPLSSLQSGFRIYGEQRDAAACDFNHDGRVDLVVSQNSGPLQVFKNVKAPPGLRVSVENLELPATVTLPNGTLLILDQKTFLISSTFAGKELQFKTKAGLKTAKLPQQAGGVLSLSLQ